MATLTSASSRSSGLRRLATRRSNLRTCRSQRSTSAQVSVDWHLSSISRSLTNVHPLYVHSQVHVHTPKHSARHRVRVVLPYRVIRWLLSQALDRRQATTITDRFRLVQHELVRSSTHWLISHSSSSSRGRGAATATVPRCTCTWRRASRRQACATTTTDQAQAVHAVHHVRHCAIRLCRDGRGRFKLQRRRQDRACQTH